MAQNRGERFVRVDFGREGVWSVPEVELTLVWQPPSVSRTRNRKDWLEQKRKQAREQKRRARKAAVQNLATDTSRLEQHQASLTPWRDPAAAMAHMRAHKPRRKPRQRQHDRQPEHQPEPQPEPEAEPEPEVDTSALVEACRARLADSRKALRGMQEAGGDGLALRTQAEDECAAAEAELSRLLEEVEQAEAKVAPLSPKAMAPKTLAELAYAVLKEDNIDLLHGFMRFDENKDGVLSADELQRGFEALTQVRLPTPQVASPYNIYAVDTYIRCIHMLHTQYTHGAATAACGRAGR